MLIPSASTPQSLWAATVLSLCLSLQRRVHLVYFITLCLLWPVYFSLLHERGDKLQSCGNRTCGICVCSCASSDWSVLGEDQQSICDTGRAQEKDAKYETNESVEKQKTPKVLQTILQTASDCRHKNSWYITIWFDVWCGNLQLGNFIRIYK